MAGRRIALLFGGRSTEHEVSVRSARSVAAGLAAAGFVPVPVAIDARGRWLDPEISAEVLGGGAPAVVAPRDATTLTADPAGGGLRRRDGSTVAIDVVFPLVHGQGGEDGRYQSLLELAGLPYVGSGVLGSALAMDKAVAKDVMAARGVDVVPGITISAADWAARRAALRDEAAGLGWPVFVKPANGGSSVGVRRVEAAAGLADAIDHALRFDLDVLVERAVDGREIECAVLGNDRVETSILGEIVTREGFYDYDAKYVDDSAELRVPAPLDEALAGRIRQTAAQAYRALGLAGFARIDFLVEADAARYYVNEANTLPGFTSISMFPRLWEASGRPLPDLVRRLVELGEERWRQRSALTTERAEDSPKVTE